MRGIRGMPHAAFPRTCPHLCSFIYICPYTCLYSCLCTCLHTCRYTRRHAYLFSRCCGTDGSSGPDAQPVRDRITAATPPDLHGSSHASRRAKIGASGIADGMYSACALAVGGYLVLSRLDEGPQEAWFYIGHRRRRYIGHRRRHLYIGHRRRRT